MGLEQRTRGGHYYYRKVRRGRQVVSVYGGAGELAAQLTQMERQERERARQAMTEGVLAVDQDLAELGILLDTLIGVTLLGSGYHRHKGQWRKRRYETSSNDHSGDPGVAGPGQED